MSSGFNTQNKAPDADYTDSGVLSEIRYPTGGMTQFEYELHDYAKVVNTKNRSVVTSQAGTASGLRIKKIITDNSNGDAVTREFFYKETPSSSASSGILNTLPQYTYSINGTDCDNYSFSISGTRSMPVIPLTKDNEGLYIGYTYVCERISTGNGGYMQYHYTSHDNGHSDILLAGGTWRRDIFASDPHCSRYFERGRLKKETAYNASGQAVSMNETAWDRYGSQGEDNPRAFLFEGIQLGHDYCSSTAYLHFCYKFLPSQKTETVYDFNGLNPVVTQTDYTYNAKNLLSIESILRSDGKNQTTKFIYPFEINSNSSVSTTIQAMTDKNILSDYAAKMFLVNGQIISAESRIYSAVGANNSIYKPTQINTFHPNNPVSESQLYAAGWQNFNLYISSDAPVPDMRTYSCHYFAISHAATVQMEVFFGEHFVDLYSQFAYYTIEIIKNDATNQSVYLRELSVIGDGYLNSGDLSYTDFFYADLLPGSYRIELKRRVDAEYNSKDGLPAGISYWSEISCAVSERYNLYNIPSFRPEIYYLYDSHGNVQEVKPAGSNQPTTYLWGYNHQYPIAKIENATYAQVKTALGNYTDSQIGSLSAQTNPNVASIGNTLRSYFANNPVLVTTYEYKPLVGLRKATDTRGIVTEYEYDNFGRLKQIKQDGKVMEGYDYHYKNQ